ncbi:MAG TPA: hypothetical protein VGS20_09155 [Candidatus Acidoferrales bacterium]|nr:hypothetical protein [Candidatus Acidoferrales bacterium]
MSPLHGYRSRIEPPGEPASETTDPAFEAKSVEVDRELAWEYGPCLHLAANGRRCERPALEGGFCAGHSLEGAESGPWTWFKRLAALALAAAILWPILEDFLTELSHWHR